MRGPQVRSRPMTVCLFDVDGTLVDSREPILRALNTALVGAGLDPVVDADLGRHVGPPLQLTLERLLAGRGEDVRLVGALVEAYRAEYRSISVGLAASYPGVQGMVDDLEGRLRLGVVTSKPAVYAVPILSALGLASMMEVIEGPDLSEIEAKPITLARALDRLGVDGAFDDITMVGDRREDIEAGHARGVRTVGVTWGFGTREELVDAGADHVVDHPEEVVPIVLGSQ